MRIKERHGRCFFLLLLWSTLMNFNVAMHTVMELNYILGQLSALRNLEMTYFIIYLLIYCSILRQFTLKLFVILLFLWGYT